MNLLIRLLNKILPEDKEAGCGYGPFKLPQDHPFTRGCNLHDWEFGEAHEGRGEKSIQQVDWELFYRWVLIARAEQTYTAKCALAREICKYWPLAHSVGPFLWDGKDE
jgi:hypothetical protein